MSVIHDQFTGLKGTVVNQTRHSTNEITPTIPLSSQKLVCH